MLPGDHAHPGDAWIRAARSGLRRCCYGCKAPKGVQLSGDKVSCETRGTLLERLKYVRSTSRPSLPAGQATADPGRRASQVPGEESSADAGGRESHPGPARDL